VSPDELKRLNIEHFERLLARTTDQKERSKIAHLIIEEQNKPDDAYPRRDPQT
jgi:hypothetical protein